MPPTEDPCEGACELYSCPQNLQNQGLRFEQPNGGAESKELPAPNCTKIRRHVRGKSFPLKARSFQNPGLNGDLRQISQGVVTSVKKMTRPKFRRVTSLASPAVTG
jgi:hypothetical protein